MANARALIDAFFAKKHFVVVGASTNRDKFGNKVLRALVSKYGAGAVHPVNPREPAIEGMPTTTLAGVIALHPAAEVAVSIITPPAASLAALKEANAFGVSAVWFQPGASDDACVEYARKKNLPILEGGPCVLVQLNVADHE